MGNLQSCVNGSHSTALPCKCVCVCASLPTCKFYAFMHTAIISSGANSGLYLEEKMLVSRVSSVSLIISLYISIQIFCFSHFLILCYFQLKQKYQSDTVTCSLWFISLEQVK